MALLELRNVKYSYKNEYQTVDAVKGISYVFDKGKMYSIVGRSGSGKTTLLSLIAGLDLPTEGEVVFEGVSTADRDIEKYRRESAAVIYQNFMLFPLLTLAENVMFPMEQNGMDTKKAYEKAMELLRKVGLTDDQANRYPAMISGGEKQRVAIARALGMGTPMILADEPTGNLDSSNSRNIIEILKHLAHDDDYCVIVVTHDEGFAAEADEMIHLKDGRRITDTARTRVFTIEE
ncbi:MAG: ABC transporter ATP-binding protein [Erysipelotrichales bacterium]|nr:ABC transporter ATP-binding protein [Erysipelotrichales bacterium]MBQ2310191.1 ABC transporter ATP-binding protein [Erysipelotrichales bacterium]MBQ5542295.1 ABC transporter ATP-binding protein [Erysipelotrichales bacterium]